MKTTTKTVENNKLIAEFMDVNINSNGTFELPQYGTIRPNGNFKTEFEDFQLKYDLSWEWLMPVIMKIADETSYVLVMSAGYSYWTNAGDEPLQEFGGYEDISNIHRAVVEFIKWHNNQN